MPRQAPQEDPWKRRHSLQLVASGESKSAWDSTAISLYSCSQGRMHSWVIAFFIMLFFCQSPMFWFRRTFFNVYPVGTGHPFALMHGHEQSPWPRPWILQPLSRVQLSSVLCVLSIISCSMPKTGSPSSTGTRPDSPSFQLSGLHPSRTSELLFVARSERCMLGLWPHAPQSHPSLPASYSAQPQLQPPDTIMRKWQGRELLASSIPVARSMPTPSAHNAKRAKFTYPCSSPPTAAQALSKSSLHKPSLTSSSKVSPNSVLDNCPDSSGS
mmetsp:Transcript_9865/g.25973  ORF Transcript_9865/g.25973 Transcript_9865/m.25973 type:complete len:270 (-) Transcript_9865:731-1540(-)